MKEKCGQCGTIGESKYCMYCGNPLYREKERSNLVYKILVVASLVGLAR